jgi:hypothetical protein
VLATVLGSSLVGMLDSQVVAAGEPCVA